MARPKGLAMCRLYQTRGRGLRGECTESSYKNSPTREHMCDQFLSDVCDQFLSVMIFIGQAI